MGRPAVSVVLAAWQPRAEWLEQAVASALGQTGVQVELIVVDDGSPEPVAPLVGREDDERVVVSRKEHGGLAAARNHGVELARAPFVRFLDADDELPPASTSRLLELAAGRGDVIAYGATVFCDAELRPVWRMRSRVSGDAREACVTGAFSVRVPAMLFPRRLFHSVRFDPGFGTTEDWDFLLRALDFAPVAGGPFDALLYRRHGGGMTADREASERDAARAIEAFFERNPALRGGPVERRAHGYLAAQSARAALTHGEAAAGLRALGRALRLSPGAVVREGRLGAQALAGRLKTRR